MNTIDLRLACAALWLLSFTAAAQGLPRAKTPEEVGMSSERLKRLTEAFKTEISKGIMPGAVLLVARRGKVAYSETMGVRDPQTNDAMPPGVTPTTAQRCSWMMSALYSSDLSFSASLTRWTTPAGGGSFGATR